MAQTGYTPILIYSSSTTTNAPSAGNLTNSTLGSELAINITDGKLFYKDNANVVQVIAWKTTPTTAGGTGLTSYAAGDLLYYASGTTLTKLAIGTAYQTLQVNAGGTAPSWQASATSTLTAQGDLLYASAANTLARLAKNTTATRYLSNTGSSNNPAWAQIDLSNGVTGVLPVANGGTNASSASITAFNNITGYTASGATGTTSTNLVFSTSPSLTTPRVITSINDTNGNELFAVTATASAVNELTVANAATTNNPSLSATGSDTNIGIRLVPKGSGNLVLASGNLVVASGNGIDFSATAGTGTSELLADYEEGDWTPTIIGDGGTSGQTYAVQSAKYVKVGNAVIVACDVRLSAKGTITGNIQLGGLPFTVLSGSYYGGGLATYSRYVTAGSWVFYAVPATTTAYAIIAPNTFAVTGDLTNDAMFFITLSYLT